MHLTVLTALIAAVAAVPAQLPPLPGNSCSSVSSSVAASACVSAASTFCASYLGTTTTTTVKTTVTSTVRQRTIRTGVTVTTTKIVTDTTYSPTTATSLVTATTTTTILPTCTIPAAVLKKRVAAPSPEPSCLTAYPSGTALSSACSCLHVTPAVSTATATSTITRTIINGFGTTTTTATAVLLSTTDVNGGTKTTIVTSTATTTTITIAPNAYATPSTFYIYVNTAGPPSLAENSNSAGRVQFDSEDSSDASTYTLTKAGNLLNSEGNYAYEPTNQQDVLFASKAFIRQQKSNALVCSVDTECNLTCHSGSSNVEQVCGAEGVFNVQSTPDTSAADGCSTIQAMVADASGQ